MSHLIITDKFSIADVAAMSCNIYVTEVTEEMAKALVAERKENLSTCYQDQNLGNSVNHTLGLFGKLIKVFSSIQYFTGDCILFFQKRASNISPIRYRLVRLTTP